MATVSTRTSWLARSYVAKRMSGRRDRYIELWSIFFFFPVLFRRPHLILNQMIVSSPLLLRASAKPELSMDVLIPAFCEGELSFSMELGGSFLHSKQ